MYLIELRPIIYESKGGGAFTLTQALVELYGVRDARILRADDLTIAVLDAGEPTYVIHVRRDGRRTRITRRKSASSRAW